MRRSNYVSTLTLIFITAMQEEVLKLILLALEDGSALSRKVLVLFVVQRLASQYPQASKTAIGHVVQLLYRASCFKVGLLHDLLNAGYDVGYGIMYLKISCTNVHVFECKYIYKSCPDRE